MGTVGSVGVAGDLRTRFSGTGTAGILRKGGRVWVFPQALGPFWSSRNRVFGEGSTAPADKGLCCLSHLDLLSVNTVGGSQSCHHKALAWEKERSLCFGMSHPSDREHKYSQAHRTVQVTVGFDNVGHQGCHSFDTAPPSPYPRCHSQQQLAHRFYFCTMCQ